MLFRLAHTDEREAVLSLYEEAKTHPLCVWNEYYPTLRDIDHDLETGNLYVLVEENKVIGALSVVPENEMDDLPHWHIRENAAEIARIAVKKSHQGRGYAALMVKEILEKLQDEIYFAVHLSVARKNIPARKTYEKNGFSDVGEAELYGGPYYLMEKQI